MIYFFYIISLLSIYYIYLYKSYYSLITIFVCLALFLSLIRKNYSTKLNFLVLLVSIIGLFIINHNIINLYFIDLKKYVEKEFIVYLIIIFGFSLILFTFFKYNGKKIILSILIPIIIFFQFILIVFAKYIQKFSISSIQETSNLNINETIFFVKNLLINNLSLNIELIYTILLSIIIYFISFLFFPKYSSKDKSNFFY